MRFRRLCLVVLTAALLVAGAAVPAAAHDPEGFQLKGRTERPTDGTSPGGVPLEPLFDIECEDGMAGIFPCENVDLESFLPLQDIGATFVNDVWGWSKDKREFALVGTWEGTAFVEVTDGDEPRYLGTLPSAAPSPVPYTPDVFAEFEKNVVGNLWGDIRVHEDVAYIGTEAFNEATGVGHGLQVFDLGKLLKADGPQEWKADAKVGNYSSHNLSLNPESKVLYVLGARDGVTECDTGGDDAAYEGGAIAYDVSKANSPRLIGCVPQDGYTHDIQCVTYEGPDRDYRNHEICFAANEDTLTLYDLTDFIEGNGDPVVIDRLTYLDVPFEPEVEGDPPNYYTHQGWLSEGQDIFFLGDELDEFAGTVEGRRTYIWDMSDLDNAQLINAHTTGNTAIDHNMFVYDDLLYQANYSAGLTILDTARARTGELKVVGSFDVFPLNDDTDFFGAWGNYPFLGDGKVIVSSSDEGLFVLDAEDAVEAAEDRDDDDDHDDDDDDDDDDEVVDHPYYRDDDDHGNDAKHRRQ